MLYNVYMEKLILHWKLPEVQVRGQKMIVNIADITKPNDKIRNIVLKCPTTTKG